METSGCLCETTFFNNCLKTLYLKDFHDFLEDTSNHPPGKSSAEGSPIILEFLLYYDNVVFTNKIDQRSTMHEAIRPPESSIVRSERPCLSTS